MTKAQIRPSARKLTTNAVHSVGTFSILKPERPPPRLPFFDHPVRPEHDPEKWKPVFRKDHVQQRAVVFRTKMQPRRLTDSDLSSLNPRLGCEMMKISARLASSNRDG